MRDGGDNGKVSGIIENWQLLLHSPCVLALLEPREDNYLHIVQIGASVQQFPTFQLRLGQGSRIIGHPELAYNIYNNIMWPYLKCPGEMNNER